MRCLHRERVAQAVRENSSRNINATFAGCRRNRCPLSKGFPDRGRDRSRAASKSRLRNWYRKVEITLNSNRVPEGGAYRTQGYPPPRWHGAGSPARARGWFPPSQAGNSKVGTATMGEAKSAVRVMGHRHAISPGFPLPRTAPRFNFQLGSRLPRAPPGPHRGAPSPRGRVLRCDLSALIIRRQESGQTDDQTRHPRKVAFLRRSARFLPTRERNVLFIRYSNRRESCISVFHVHRTAISRVCLWR